MIEHLYKLAYSLEETNIKLCDILSEVSGEYPFKYYKDCGQTGDGEFVHHVYGHLTYRSQGDGMGVGFTCFYGGDAYARCYSSKFSRGDGLFYGYTEKHLEGDGRGYGFGSYAYLEEDGSGDGWCTESLMGISAS